MLKFNKQRILSIACISVFCYACGVSPLLHHNDASTTSSTPSPLASKSETHREKTCSFSLPTETLCGDLEWIKNPTVDEEGEFTLRFWKKYKTTPGNPDLSSITTGNLGVDLWMKSMNHGSSQKVVITPTVDSTGKVVPGSYQAKPIVFTMKGAWEIWVQIKDSNGQVLDQSKIDFTAN